MTACPYRLESPPDTLRCFIEQLVRDGVEHYNHRLQLQDDAPLLTREDIDTMSQVGKIGFGIPFGSREADLSDALHTAYQGFTDGLYRIFIGEREIESLDTPLGLREGDTITIIRLVMLTGGWF